MQEVFQSDAVGIPVGCSRYSSLVQEEFQAGAVGISVWYRRYSSLVQ